MSASIVWLASYPRSGNTFLRTVLYHCFGLRSGSVYANDLLGLQAVEAATGHIEQSNRGRIEFGDQLIRPVKTHAVPFGDGAAIYVLRNGRDAVVSLYHFWRERQSLLDIVEGRNLFGTWSEHVTSWAPRSRANTLLLRYEDLVGDLNTCIDHVAHFLQREPSGRTIPSRAELAALDGRWIKPVDTPKVPLEGRALERFWEINGSVMREFGYC